jgi:putative ABC transport system permease protein
MKLVDRASSSARALLRAPGLAVTAILTLSLGIGLSTAVFTVADPLLLRKLPVHDQERLVTLWGEKRDGSVDNWPLGITQARDFARRSRALESIAYVDYYGSLPIPTVSGDNVTLFRRALVSGNYFDVLGVQPVVGRTLRPSDDVVGAAPVIVISYGVWQRQFSGNTNAVGRQITLQIDGVAYTIVGVMPAGLEFPRGADFWAPYAPARLRTAKDSAFAVFDLIGRLAPRATPANAQAELNAYYTGPDASLWSRDLRAVVHTFPRVVLGDVRPAVLVFAAAAALLLLITCIDVANLLLVRGLTRVREIAVRSALGGSRSQIVGQLLAENALLAIAGGAPGVAVAAVAVRGFLVFAPANVPLLDTVRVNTPALLGALGITAVAMLLFGLAPALVSARADLQEVLRSGTRQSAGRTSRLVREALVTTQVSLAVLVLSAAALIGRSFVKLENANLAFEPSHLLIAELGLRYDRYQTLDQVLIVLQGLLARLRGTPGVEAVSPVVAVPFSGTAGWTGRAGIEGQSPQEAAKNPMFSMELVTPDYFRTFGLRVLRGRALTDADRKGAEPVVVVSESTARAYWPSQDPIGKRLLMGGSLDQGFTVVGVVPDTRYRELRDARGSVYYPLAQSIFPFAPMTLAIRTIGRPAAVVSALRRLIPEAASGIVLARAEPFETFMEAPLAQPRLNAFLLAVFALAAAALAAIGLFGVMATMVRQRRRELGVRVALGATVRDIESIVVGRGLAVAGVGVALGLGGSVLANRLLSSLLYQTSPTDIPTLAGVATLLLLIAVLASLIPARSSARIDPAIALRAEG